MSDGLTMWSVNVTRDHGGERSKWPRLSVWRGSCGLHVRGGWRFTAWGLHLVRNFYDPRDPA